MKENPVLTIALENLCIYDVPDDECPNEETIANTRKRFGIPDSWAQETNLKIVEAKLLQIKIALMVTTHDQLIRQLKRQLSEHERKEEEARQDRYAIACQNSVPVDGVLYVPQ